MTKQQPFAVVYSEFEVIKEIKSAVESLLRFQNNCIKVNLDKFHIRRVRSHERRNELKPLWDFISVENLTSVFSQLFTFVHMNWGEMKLKTVWISYRSFWSKWNFKPAWFSCEHNLPETKWISADPLDVAFNAHVCLKLNAGMDFISVILTEMKFNFEW